MIEGVYNIADCPKHGSYIVNANGCPRCGHKNTDVMSIPMSTDKPKTSPKCDLSVVSGVSSAKDGKRAKNNDIPKMTPTAEKLSIPLSKYDAIVYYIRWDITEKVAIKNHRKRKIRAYWFDGHWFSELELWFWQNWKDTNYAMPTPEYKFHPEQSYKFDFAWDSDKIAVEMEGGTRSRGRHVRGDGYKKDTIKYNEAARLGWRVFRFTDKTQNNIAYMMQCFQELQRNAA